VGRNTPLKETRNEMRSRGSLSLLASIAAVFMAGGCAHHSPSPVQSNSGRGAALFAKNCASCHGSAGAPGPVGPWLHGIKKRRSRDEIEAAVMRPDPPMPKLYPGTLSAQDVDDIAAYVDNL